MLKCTVGVFCHWNDDLISNNQYWVTELGFCDRWIAGLVWWPRYWHGQAWTTRGEIVIYVSALCVFLLRRNSALVILIACNFQVWFRFIKTWCVLCVWGKCWRICFTLTVKSPVKDYHSDRPSLSYDHCFWHVSIHVSYSPDQGSPLFIFSLKYYKNYWMNTCWAPHLSASQW